MCKLVQKGGTATTTTAAALPVGFQWLALLFARHDHPTGNPRMIDWAEVFASKGRPLQQLRELHALHSKIIEVLAGSSRKK
jgi:hypothetical protein